MNLAFIHRRYGWLGLALLGGVLFLAVASDTLKEFFYGFVHWIEGAIEYAPVLGALGFFVLSGLSAMIAFASSVILVPSALLAWGFTLSFLLLWLGWVAGSVLAYAIGRKLARPTLSFFVAKEKLARYEHFVTRETDFFAILLFCLAVPSEIPGYVLGTLRYPFRRFLSAVALSEAAYATVLILAAENLLDEKFLLSALLLLSLIAFAGFALFSLRYFSRPREEGSPTETPSQKKE